MSLPPRVLLVDDDGDVRLMTRVNLTFEGFEVDEAADGNSAVDKALAVPPDAVVLDLMMPGRDGFEVLRTLRSDVRLADVPVVVLTARADRAAEEEGWTAGATAYMVKPFTVSALATTLRTLLGQDQAERDEGRRAAMTRLGLDSD